jgi:SWI/SNF-related matrix-associated actin-dependent regulator 1 of chromatin subfamily A
MKEFVGEHYMLLDPYPYQLEGVRYALDNKRCIFGDQPGLGKTLQAICAVVKAHKEAKQYGETFPTLVICPASLKINWQREFKKFANIDAIILDDRNRGVWQRYYEMKRPDGEALAPVYIVNYESLKKFFVTKVKDHARFTLRSVQFDERVKMFKSIIIDESHKCKSSKTQQSKYVEGICKDKQWIFELTGTPVVNNNTDLVQQLKILGRLDDFGGYKQFVGRYCDGPKQSSNLKELNYRLWCSCFFRREKQKVLTQLPEKTRQYITCDITNRKEYEDAERDVLSYLRTYKNANDDKIARAMRGQIMVKMGILKAIAARGKIKAVSDFIHDIIDGGEKLILFAYLKEVVEALKKEFPDAVTVTGADNVAQKQNAVDRFQNDPECKLIILNYRSGGTGLTLTAASRVGFIEFPWTYSDCEQAEDRAHRNGQKNNVNCYYFLGDKTIDKYMYSVIQSKKDIANEVTGTTTQIEEDIVNITMNLFKDRL